MANVIAELRVQQLDDGNVTVAGPLVDKTFCYGMLERAKDAIREFDPSKQPSVIIPVNGGMGRIPHG